MAWNVQVAANLTLGLTFVLIAGGTLNNSSCPDSCQCTSSSFGSKSASPEGVSVLCEAQDPETIQYLTASLPSNVFSFTVRYSEITGLIDFCCLEEVQVLDLSHNRISDALSYFQFTEVLELNLQHNQFQILRKDEFICFPNVEVLRLDFNEIQVIDHETFRLLKLRELHLSNNRLVYVSERIFRFLPMVESLDLSGNMLSFVHSRNFYYSRRLKVLDLSDNKIGSVDERAFEPLQRLVDINFSNNNLEEVPAAALMDMRFLQLNFNGNPIKSLKSNALDFLQVESVSFDQVEELRMVMENSFSNIKHLRKVSISNCENLEYMSPNWLANESMVEEVNLSNNNLRIIPFSSFQSPALKIVDITKNPLDCNCLSPIVANISLEKFVTDHECLQKVLRGQSTVNESNSCPPALIPSTNESLLRPVGMPAELFCAVVGLESASVTWVLPNGTSVNKYVVYPRHYATNEQLSIKYLLLNDSGTYKCTLVAAGNRRTYRTVQLTVEDPGISLYPLTVSSNSITLGWNKTVGILQHGEYKLQYGTSNEDLTVSTTTLLPNFWNTYTIAKLQPQTNYTRCTDIKTASVEPNVKAAFSYSLIALFTGSFCLLSAFCTIRCIHRRYCIWHEDKCRSRMIESLSGQGFLSSLDSIYNPGITYENSNVVNKGIEEQESAMTVTTEVKLEDDYGGECSYSKPAITRTTFDQC
ncbi:unnamed protein product [Soboliphyme baturini]|uniref:Ig-like domain-containing protein n=1 Tax=Soboliphyme baturini TaxID=241478 RepID=A0A183IGW1_9BILA|nr:unnamed protein product [Soboliphyme baturini]